MLDAWNICEYTYMDWENQKCSIKTMNLSGLFCHLDWRNINFWLSCCILVEWCKDEALVKLTDDIKDRRSRGEFVAGLVCDASSAFDLLCRDTTIAMLQRLGAKNSVTNLIRDFLEDSKQFVTINDQVSDVWSQDVGSGQGHMYIESATI